MRKYDGVIFDIDGTLTSTNELIFSSFNHIMKKYLNKSMTNDEIISLFGPTEDQIIEDWFGVDAEKVRREYYSFYKANHAMADIYPGIKELLHLLKEKNVLLSIYTGKGREATLITLKKLGIYDYFDLIITGSDVKEHKPSPEGIEIFLDKYSLDKEKVLMVGDAPADIKAARAAGIKVASVVWDSYAYEKVLLMESDFVFHTVNELKKFFMETL
ncbi:MAG: HAD family hydrolase [Ignavibacteriaceae bacterium]|jgi:HAD superfamily hydrolase (TIGR01549 family)|nr:HAD family hydrolase [Ignavibacteriaceae bacterium]